MALFAIVLWAILLYRDVGHSTVFSFAVLISQAVVAMIGVRLLLQVVEDALASLRKRPKFVHPLSGPSHVE